MRKPVQLILITVLCAWSFSCKKDKILTSSSVRLTFSQDSILFDTVFTKIGSTTKLFTVHNPNNGVVNISSIRLARGTNSFYKLNVDGVPGKSFSNIQIAAKDSLYIFVEVTIDPNASPSNSPFIYRDSILFDLNGNEQHMDLIAFGQNAYYHMPNQKIIFSNTQALFYDTLHVPVNGTDTWLSDKPHLIYGYVVVDSTQTLVINPGAQIYLHNGGGIWVYRYGAIQVNGTQTNPITFQGDRLEDEYKDIPGQWDRIWINEGSKANVINYAVIKNGYIGVHAGYAVFDGVGDVYTPGIAAKLSLTNTIIQNCSYAGLLAHSYTITGGNDVIVNCGQHICEFDFGGNYAFYQCTFANYWNQTNNSTSSSARTTPSFYFNNYYNGNVTNAFDSLYFGNCIFDGSMAEEFQFDTIAGGFSKRTAFAFNYCALKTGSLQANTAPTNTCEKNQPMNFINTGLYNFDLNSNSAAINQGNSSYTGNYTTDIKGKPLNSPNPNIGAYQQ